MSVVPVNFSYFSQITKKVVAKHVKIVSEWYIKQKNNLKFTFLSSCCSDAKLVLKC